MVDLLKELEAVALLAEKATPDVWINDGPHLFIDTRVQVCCGRGRYECCGSPDVDGDVEEIGKVIDESDAAYIAAMHNFLRTHHAEIAEVVADARRYRWLRDNVQPFRTDNEEPHALVEVCIGQKGKHIAWFDLIDKTAHVGVVTLDQAVDAAIDAQHNSAREGSV